MSRPFLFAGVRDKAAGAFEQYETDKAEALETIKKWLAGAAITGAGIRGAVGLGDMLVRGPGVKPLKRPPPVVVDMPYRAQSPTTKAPVMKAAATTLSEILQEPKTWTTPALVAGVPVALGGSYALVDRFLAWRRQQGLKRDVDDAQNEYRQLAIGERKPLDMSKLAANYEAVIAGTTPPDQDFAKVATVFNELAERCTASKSAEGILDDLGGKIRSAVGAGANETVPEAIGGAALNNATPWRWGGNSRDWATPLAYYLTAAGGLAGLTGFAGYRYARENNPELEKAKQMRDALENSALSATPPVFARLVPVGDDGRPVRPDRRGLLGRSKTAEHLTQVVSSQDLRTQAQQFVARLLGRTS